MLDETELKYVDGPLAGMCWGQSLEVGTIVYGLMLRHGATRYRYEVCDTQSGSRCLRVAWRAFIRGLEDPQVAELADLAFLLKRKAGAAGGLTGRTFSQVVRELEATGRRFMPFAHGIIRYIENHGRDWGTGRFAPTLPWL